MHVISFSRCGEPTSLEGRLALLLARAQTFSRMSAHSCASRSPRVGLQEASTYEDLTRLRALYARSRSETFTTAPEHFPADTNGLPPTSAARGPVPKGAHRAFPDTARSL
jgi:hypothetical protein